MKEKGNIVCGTWELPPFYHIMSTRHPPPSIFLGGNGDVNDDMGSVRSLSDVPEEGPFSPSTPNSPYFDASSSAAASTSTLQPPTKSSRSSTSSRKSSTRSLTGRSSSDNLNGTQTSRRTLSNASAISTVGTSAKDSRPSRTAALPRTRSTPRLPHEKDADDAPSAVMYWSRAPVYGTIPQRSMRGHTVTLLDNTAWVFGGCDDKDTARDIYCFDVGSCFGPLSYSLSLTRLP